MSSLQLEIHGDEHKTLRVQTLCDQISGGLSKDPIRARPQLATNAWLTHWKVQSGQVNAMVQDGSRVLREASWWKKTLNFQGQVLLAKQNVCRNGS